MSNQVISGVIDSIYTKEINTKRGPSNVYHAMINGQDVNLGFKTSHSQGETVTWEVEHKYGGLQYVGPSNGQPTSVQSGGQSNSSSNAAPVRATAFPTPKGTKDVSIIRQNSMTHATKIVAGMLDNGSIELQTEDEYINKVLEVAYIVADYSTGWREVKEAAARAAYDGEK